MSDGKLFGRIIRTNKTQTRENGSLTIFLTLAVDRGTYKDSSGQVKSAKTDFIELTKYIPQGNRLPELLENLAKNHAWINVDFSVKTYTPEDGFLQTFLTLNHINNFESRASINDRLKRQGATKEELAKAIEKLPKEHAIPDNILKDVQDLNDLFALGEDDDFVIDESVK